MTWKTSVKFGWATLLYIRELKTGRLKIRKSDEICSSESQFVPLLRNMRKHEKYVSLPQIETHDQRSIYKSRGHIKLSKQHIFTRSRSKKQTQKCSSQGRCPCLIEILPKLLLKSLRHYSRRSPSAWLYVN